MPRLKTPGLDRRQSLTLLGAGSLGVLLAGCGYAPVAATPAGPQRVKLVAQKFKYTPAELVLKRGQAYVVELTTLDFAHGFNLPDLKLRADLVPGKTVELALRFDQPGKYDFFCDNYCGDGHEGMDAHIIVET